MAVFQIGSIIRSRREEMGLSQEDLADGICAVPTLSRIENNERLPTKNHFEMLMQRLGYSAMSLDFFTDKGDFQIHEIKIRLRYAYISKDYAHARLLLEKFEKLLKEPTKIDEQFLILYRTLLFLDEYSESEVLKRFEGSLRLTCPKYNVTHIPHVLSYEEIILLNNIAISYDKAGNGLQAITILYTLKEYYEHKIVSTDEALRTQPMILYNLSKVLGLQERYDECIEICNLGIRIARTSGRSVYLGHTFFNKAWAQLKRNQPGDRENAKMSLKYAWYAFVIMDYQKDADAVCAFYEETFAETISA